MLATKEIGLTVPSQRSQCPGLDAFAHLAINSCLRCVGVSRPGWHNHSHRAHTRTHQKHSRPREDKNHGELFAHQCCSQGECFLQPWPASALAVLTRVALMYAQHLGQLDLVSSDQSATLSARSIHPCPPIRARHSLVTASILFPSQSIAIRCVLTSQSHARSPRAPTTLQL